MCKVESVLDKTRFVEIGVESTVNTQWKFAMPKNTQWKLAKLNNRFMRLNISNVDESGWTHLFTFFFRLFNLTINFKVFLNQARTDHWATMFVWKQVRNCITRQRIEKYTGISHPNVWNYFRFGDPISFLVGDFVYHHTATETPYCVMKTMPPMYNINQPNTRRFIIHTQTIHNVFSFFFWYAVPENVYIRTAQIQCLFRNWFFFYCSSV